VKKLSDKLDIQAAMAARMKTSLWVSYLSLSKNNLQQAKKEEISWKRRKSIIATIVFSTACLECFINEMAIENLTNEWKSIERLSLPDKWLITIKLISKNKTFLRDSDIYKNLNWLREKRNTLIHYKAKWEELSEKKRSTYIDEILSLKNAERAFEIIKNSIKKFYKLAKLKPTNGVYSLGIIS